MVRHLAGIAEIVDDIDSAVRFYRDVLGLSVQEIDPGYAVVSMPGTLHFGIWLRKHAARIIYQDAAAADRIPLGFTIGFEVDSVGNGAERLARGGSTVVQPPHDEPWGQRTARFRSPSGALCEVSETPAARRIAHDVAPQDDGGDRAAGA